MINHLQVTTCGGRATSIDAEPSALCKNAHDYQLTPEANRFLAQIKLTLLA